MSKCKNCNAQMADGDRFCQECGTDQKGERLEALMTIGGLETVDSSQTRTEDRGSMPDIAPGAEFAGRYVVENVIGKGGMGVVYRALDKLADKPVALKLIRADRLAGQSAVKRLISEGLTTRDIRHQNIIAVYDVGEAGGQPFVSMEFIKGQSLRDWHREKIRQREDVPLRVAARIIAEVLDGLAAAHAAGVIHRDLSPENIMLTEEPTETSAPLKILDFGIARVTSGAVESGTGTGLGKPRYMAPEQITAADSAGPEADLYSLSVIFYELLVDVLPQGHWQPPSGGRSDVPKGIDNLIERGLSNRPANRPQTAKDYRKQLVDAVNIGGVYRPPAKPEPLPTPGPGLNAGWLKWGGIGLAGVLAVFVIAAIAGGGSENAGEIYDDTDDVIYENENRDTYSPPPPSIYADLNGQWDDGLGNRYSINIGRDGAFNGTGQSVYGYPLEISGRLNGAAGEFVLNAPSAGMRFTGRLQWDRGCHVNFTTYDMNGSLAGQGQMHVNHAPGAPCPS